jgi:hypothetical protein
MADAVIVVLQTLSISISSLTNVKPYMKFTQNIFYTALIRHVMPDFRAPARRTKIDRGARISSSHYSTMGIVALEVIY